MVRPWRTYVGRTLRACGSPVGRLWVACGASVGRPWVAHRQRMGCPRGVRGGLLGGVRQVAMRCPWGVSGVCPWLASG